MNKRKTPHLITVRITRAEFLKLPLRARRRILKEQAENIKHEKFLDTMDCEDEP